MCTSKTIFSEPVFEMTAHQLLHVTLIAGDLESSTREQFSHLQSEISSDSVCVFLVTTQGIQVNQVYHFMGFNQTMAISALHSYANTYLLRHHPGSWSPGHLYEASFEKHHCICLGAICLPWKSEDGDGQEIKSAFLNLTLTQNWNAYMTRTAGLDVAVVQ